MMNNSSHSNSARENQWDDFNTIPFNKESIRNTSRVKREFSEKQKENEDLSYGSLSGFWIAFIVFPVILILQRLMS